MSAPPPIPKKQPRSKKARRWWWTMWVSLFFTIVPPAIGFIFYIIGIVSMATEGAGDPDFDHNDFNAELPVLMKPLFYGGGIGLLGTLVFVACLIGYIRERNR